MLFYIFFKKLHEGNYDAVQANSHHTLLNTSASSTITTHEGKLARVIEFFLKHLLNI